MRKYSCRTFFEIKHFPLIVGGKWFSMESGMSCALRRKLRVTVHSTGSQHAAERPASTATSSPVMALARSLSRYRIVSATSIASIQKVRHCDEHHYKERKQYINAVAFKIPLAYWR